MDGGVIRREWLEMQLPSAGARCKLPQDQPFLGVTKGVDVPQDNSLCPDLEKYSFIVSLPLLHFVSGYLQGNFQNDSDLGATADICPLGYEWALKR
jgi:hypothetical protein